MSKGKPLSFDKIAHLEQMVLEGLRDQDIAAKLDCSIPTVARYRKKKGLFKIGKGKLNITDQDATSRTNINQKDSTIEEKEASWAAHLKSSKRYLRLKTQFSETDLAFFVDEWVKYHLSLESMSVAEDDLLENLITYSLRMNANQRNMKELDEQELMLKRQLYGDDGQRELDLEDENQRYLWSVCESNDRRKQEVNKEFKDLRDGYEKLHRALNTTREQREQKNKIGADTFLTFVRMFQDQKKRKEVGRENEYIRISTQEQTKKLKKIHDFSDNSKEAILLDGSDFKKTVKTGIDIAGESNAISKD